MNVSGLRRNFKNFAHSYSDAQVKVREATSNDPWGPSSTLMAEIADMTYNVVAFSEIMSMIWKRTNDHGKNWRHVYKALLLLEYLIKAGSEKVAHQCKENIYAIQTLREFQYYEEGKDQGMNVREKAKMLVDLLKNEQRLKEERTKALAAKERFTRSNGFGSNPSLNTASAVSTGGRRVSSEIEGVRPANEDEEELQLQLALAMSREEAEAEEAKKRSDDVRLQMAISQSQQDFQPERPQAKAPPQSNLVDLLDISFDAPIPVAQAPSAWNNNVDPWKANAEAWGNSSAESSPAHQNWNNNNTSWGQPAPKESWLNDDDPFKVDPWIGASATTNINNNTQNNNDIFGSNHSSPFKQQTNNAAPSGGLADLDFLMKPAAAPAPVISSTNPFADTMFQAPPQAQRVIDPWANLGGATAAYPQIPSQNPPHYSYQYNNNNTNNNESRNETGGQQGASLYPNLNGNSNTRKGLFVE